MKLFSKEMREKVEKAEESFLQCDYEEGRCVQIVYVITAFYNHIQSQQ